MVREEEDRRLLSRCFQRVEDFADLAVDVSDIGEIALARAADLVGRDVEGAPVAGVHQAFGMGVLIVIGDGGGRFEFGRALIHIPELAAGDEGVVRVGEADRQAPRAGVAPAREVVEFLDRVEGDLVVVFELVRDLGHACASDRAEVVIPPVDAFARFAVIGGPAEIGGVDVGGEPFLEAVKLVGADEVHLARQRRVIARAAQVVGVGGNVRGEFGGVVIDPRPFRQRPRHEGGAGGGAEGRGRVGIGEPRRAFREPPQVRGVQESGGAIGKERAGQLVDHEDEDIRLRHGGQRPFSSVCTTRHQAKAGSGKGPQAAGRGRFSAGVANGRWSGGIGQRFGARAVLIGLVWAGSCDRGRHDGC